MLGFANIQDFGADPTGVSPCNAALTSAQATGVTVVIPAGSFRLEDTFSFGDDETWRFDGGAFFMEDDTKPIFRASGVSNLSLLGNVKCRGNLTTEADTGESAIVFDGVNRCYAQRITATYFKGSAVKIIGASAGTFRGDTLRIDSLAVHQSKRGLEVVPGSGAEYCVIGSIEAVGNILGVSIGAGNTRILGGNIVDNYNGVDLIAGHNHGHGGLHGVNINHNSGFNLRATNLQYGFTADGCHFFGDSPTAGKIIIQNCAGVTISDGMIACMIEMIGAGKVNNIRDNFVLGQGAISGSGMPATQRAGNYTENGGWIGNNY